MTPTEEFAIRCIQLYMDANPDDPDVIAFRQAMDELDDALEQLTFGKEPDA
jgi:hypothetical protein